MTALGNIWLGAMLILRLLVTAISLFLANFSLAQITPPKSGITIDKTFTVPQRTKIPSFCIALQSGEMLVLLDGAELEVETKSQHAGYRDEISVLLNSSKTKPVSFGCAVFSFADVPITYFLFDEALQTGRAVLIEQSSGKLHLVVQIRYAGEEAFGGNIFYYDSNARRFQVRPWWIR
jgi:hypothetical protein